jgi:hypothetical protein
VSVLIGRPVGLSDLALIGFEKGLAEAFSADERARICGDMPALDLTPSRGTRAKPRPETKMD